MKEQEGGVKEPLKIHTREESRTRGRSQEQEGGVKEPLKINTRGRSSRRPQLTRERVRLKFLILATSSPEKLGDTSLLIGLTWQAIMMVLRRRRRRRRGGAGGEAALLAGQAAVGADGLHAVARLHQVHQVVVQDDVHGARQLAGRRLLRHLLHRDGLVVLVHRQPELRLQGVVLLVLGGGGEGVHTRAGAKSGANRAVSVRGVTCLVPKLPSNATKNSSYCLA
ncbi:hypothetical protein EYF80_056899 [Liparis tanakae]|uniref:Uncharacterized protein n=1 Tax=Liparis tanakae TaxID=230148 RepID=A0A4Z2EWJ0_9TELE|nr:hypothetical protein EYF80_056899 [Liparis tanakae]